MSEHSESGNRVDEVIADYLDAARAGQQPNPAEWLARYPEFAGELASFFADRERFTQAAAPLMAPAAPEATVDSTPSPLGDHPL